MNGESEAGAAAEAVGRDRRVVEQFPDSAEAHYNLGNALLRSGDVANAIETYRRAVELRPAFREAHSNLGVALQFGGRFNEAKACFLRAIELGPNDALAHNNLGRVELTLGSNDEAQECFRRAIRLQPEFADAVFNLGHALQLAERLDEAAECFERTINMQPGHVWALTNLGNILRDQYRLGQAIDCYLKAIAVNPNFAEVHSNLGVALRDNKQPDEAIISFRRALALKADYAEAENNLGNAYKDIGMLEEALACHKRAVAISPNEPVYYNNLGLCSLDLGHLEEAEKCFEHSLRLKPDAPQVHWSRSLLMLLKGDLENGWIEHEWRWRCPEWLMFCKLYQPSEHPQPVWDGSSLDGKTILLQAEQGLGDTIQFVRYVRMVKRNGGRIVLECQQALMALLANIGADELVAQGGALPPFDVRASLLTLPAIFKTTLESVPSEVPYLFAKPGLVELWREKLADCSGTRVGINWRGRPGRGVYRLRDIPLDCFAGLARVPGVRLVSLQGGAGGEDLVGAGSGDLRTTGVRGQETRAQLGATAGAGSGDPRTTDPRTTALPAIVDLGSEVDTVHGAFMDTAAIMMNLDLVITSDTAIAHLAGALGVPVWVALPFAADWRWLLGRSDSPWYPTMRLFRQKTGGDWNGVFEEIEGELRGFAKRQGDHESDESHGPASAERNGEQG